MLIHFSLSPEARRNFLKLGKEVPQDQHSTVDLSALSPASRAYLAGMDTALFGHVDLSNMSRSPREWVAQTIPTTPQEWDALLAVHQADAQQREAARQEKLAAELAAFIERCSAYQPAGRMLDRPPYLSGGYEKLPRFAEALAASAAAARRYEGAKAALQAARDAEQAAEDAAKAALVAEKAAWIAAHGSAFLKKAHDAGYDCQRRYVTERAAREHPGYAVDFDNTADWGPRSCPTEAALAEATAVGGRVVWLTQAVRSKADTEEAYDDEFEQCQAVVIRNYLGKYDLVKIQG